MRWRNWRPLVILSILLSFTLLSGSIPSCGANLMIVGVVDEGSSFHNGTNICMPLADVQINITRMRDTINTSLDSEFHITTNTTQNATLAFVYPSLKYVDNLLYDDTNKSRYMHIYGNNTLLPYAVRDHYDLIRIGFTEDSLEEYPFINAEVEFAVITVELEANTTLIVSTKSGFVFTSDLDQFEYTYIVGSARTFDGHTLESVHFRVIENIRFLEKEFDPDDSLNVTEDGSVTDAIWSFNISEFSSDTVRFNGVVRQHGRFQAIDFVMIGTIVIVLLAFFRVIYKRRL
ncbi:MAG: hypothetical protein ACFFEK_07910 [Candidatus Thorarchaeota archaeon]